MERILKGIGVAPGLAVAAAAVVRALPSGQTVRAAQGPAAERNRFQTSLTTAAAELEALEQETRGRLGDAAAAIFGAHRLILNDPEFVDRVEAALAVGATAEAAVAEAGREVAAILAGLDDPYFRERAKDMQDIGGRLLRLLAGHGDSGLPTLTAPAIVVASDLLPSQTARLDRAMVRGLVMAEGGPTSHTAILARTMGLAAVVGLGAALEGIADGQRLVVDGDNGIVVVDPSDETLARCRARQAGDEQERLELDALRDLPGVTADGHRVELGASIAGPADVSGALAAGAEGIGLFRTEFLYMDRTDAPSEDEQFAIYREVAERMTPRPVIIRTLDAGGDKPVPYLDIPVEANPFLGWRGIRFCLDQRVILKAQLRAILRAAAYGSVRVMFPMVSTVAELRRARALLEECRRELVGAGVATGPVAVGIMVEVPAAALCADKLAAEADFFSIGTNDLTQYTLAVDRGNRTVSALYDPMHPAVLRLIERTVVEAHRLGRWVGLCGEIGANVDALAVLVGLGLDEISVSAPALPQLKARLRVLTLEACQAEARRVLA